MSATTDYRDAHGMGCNACDAVRVPLHRVTGYCEACMGETAPLAPEEWTPDDICPVFDPLCERCAPWSEYDAAAEYVAAHGGTGAEGDPLPPLVSGAVVRAINADVYAFAERVRSCRYAKAMQEDVAR